METAITEQKIQTNSATNLKNSVFYYPKYKKWQLQSFSFFTPVVQKNKNNSKFAALLPNYE